jgi:hypothetical protein
VSLPSRDQQRTRMEGKPAGCEAETCVVQGVQWGAADPAAAPKVGLAPTPSTVRTYEVLGAGLPASRVICMREVMAVVSQHRSYGVDRMPPCVVMSVKSPLLAGLAFHRRRQGALEDKVCLSLFGPSVAAPWLASGVWPSARNECRRSWGYFQ